MPAQFTSSLQSCHIFFFCTAKCLQTSFQLTNLSAKARVQLRIKNRATCATVFFCPPFSFLIPAVEVGLDFFFLILKIFWDDRKFYLISLFYFKKSVSWAISASTVGPAGFHIAIVDCAHVF